MIKTEEQALRRIEGLLELQRKIGADAFPCPRCGHNRMQHKAEENALSRHAAVYICNECGLQEAMLDTQCKELPLMKWGMVL